MIQLFRYALLYKPKSGRLKGIKCGLQNHQNGEPTVFARQHSLFSVGLCGSVTMQFTGTGKYLLPIVCHSGRLAMKTMSIIIIKQLLSNTSYVLDIVEVSLHEFCKS